MGTEGGTYEEGTFTVSGWFDDPVSYETAIVPSEFALNGVYPNPFNPSTVISYQLSAKSFVNLRVYDISGRKVTELVNGWRDAGIYEAVFDGSGLASGVYLYTLSAGDYTATGKMVIIR